MRCRLTLPMPRFLLLGVFLLALLPATHPQSPPEHQHARLLGLLQDPQSSIRLAYKDQTRFCLYGMKPGLPVRYIFLWLNGTDKFVAPLAPAIPLLDTSTALSTSRPTIHPQSPSERVFWESMESLASQLNTSSSPPQVIPLKLPTPSFMVFHVLAPNRLLLASPNFIQTYDSVILEPNILTRISDFDSWAESLGLEIIQNESTHWKLFSVGLEGRVYRNGSDFLKIPDRGPRQTIQMNRLRTSPPKWVTQLKTPSLPSSSPLTPQEWYLFLSVCSPNTWRNLHHFSADPEIWMQQP